jgi:molybdate transport system permease protein
MVDAQAVKRDNPGRVLAALGVGILLLLVILYLVLPVVALFLRTTPDLFFSSLGDPQVLSGLWLSLLTSLATLSVVVLLGTPFAFFHSRSRYPGKVFVDTLIDLPLVLPPAVAGLGLLLLYGRTGLIGHFLDLFGITIAFSTLAVIMAQIFVASPFYIRQAKALFEQMDPAYEQTARTLGASPLRIFLGITIPLTANGLVSGAVMTFARALGEFGATIMFAGNLPGVTQTMPLAVYGGLEGNFNIGITIAILLVILSFAIMAAIRFFARREGPHA